MTTPATCQLALKEWAITVKALADGDQIMMLRKGGIHEESKDFRVVHPEFLLYPTYLHQKEDLLKDSHQPRCGSCWPTTRTTRTRSRSPTGPASMS